MKTKFYKVFLRKKKSATGETQFPVFPLAPLKEKGDFTLFSTKSQKTRIYSKRYKIEDPFLGKNSYF
jgi:hypothetical protein